MVEAATKLAGEVGDLLRRRGLTLAIVESATGGLISNLITDIPGSSDYYKGSITAYSDEVKMKMAGVKEATLAQHGAVSRQVAEEMARGGRKRFGADICLADTGIAGPGGAIPEKPAGLFYIGLSRQSQASSRQHRFNGGRQQNKQMAAEAALSWLREYLTGLG